MDRYGNVEQPDRAFADKLAHALGERHVHRIEQARMVNRSIGSRAVDDRDSVQRDCGLCGRRALVGFVAYWAHLKDRHAEEIMRMIAHRSAFVPESECFEDALIRVCNALTLDDACAIATAALIGEQQQQLQQQVQR